MPSPKANSKAAVAAPVSRPLRHETNSVLHEEALAFLKKNGVLSPDVYAKASEKVQKGALAFAWGGNTTGLINSTHSLGDDSSIKYLSVYNDTKEKFVQSKKSAINNDDDKLRGVFNDAARELMVENYKSKKFAEVYTKVFQHFDLNKILTQSAFKVAKSEMQTVVATGKPSPNVAKAMKDKENGTASKDTSLASSSKKRKRIDEERVPIDDAFWGEQRDLSDRKGEILYEQSDLGTWACLLNKADVQANANKFYILQLITLETSKKEQFRVWRRWGRVGVPGQNQTKKFDSLEAAKKDYANGFKSKCGHDWVGWGGKDSIDVSHYPAKTNNYVVVELDVDDDKKLKKSKLDVQSSKLDPKVAKLIDLITDEKMMQHELKKAGFDSKKMPLGKISDQMIDAGYKVLQEINSAIESQKKGADLDVLSSKFYSLIPHNVGFARLPTLKTAAEVKEKLDLIESLQQISEAMKLVEDGETQASQGMNPLDARYSKLGYGLSPFTNKDKEFKLVEEMVDNTYNNNSRSNYGFSKLVVKNVFAVLPKKSEGSSIPVPMDEEVDMDDGKKKGMKKAPAMKAMKKKAEDPEEAEPAYPLTEERALLWHGSRLTNWCGILKNGLLIAPPSAPVSGYMFGKGVYFADLVGKSAQYCRVGNPKYCPDQAVDPDDGKPSGLLLLNEVVLGKQKELKTSDFYAEKQLGKDCLAVKAIGRTVPKGWAALTIEESTGKILSRSADSLSTSKGKKPLVRVPIGKVEDVSIAGSYLCHNEYIVYKTDQIQPRYLCELAFVFN